MSAARTLEGTPRFEWETVIRRVDMPLTTKAFALLLATYATTTNGEDIRPGNARLMRISGMSERTVNGALKSLRELGLIECVAEGRSRGRNGGGLAAVYRLTIPSDLLSTVSMLDPGEKTLMSAGLSNHGDEPQHAAVHSASIHPQLSTNEPQSVTNEPQLLPESTAVGCTPPTHLTPTHLIHAHESPKSPLTNARERNETEEQNRQRQMRALEALMRAEEAKVARV